MANFANFTILEFPLNLAGAMCADPLNTVPMGALDLGCALILLRQKGELGGNREVRRARRGEEDLTRRRNHNNAR